MRDLRTLLAVGNGFRVFPRIAVKRLPLRLQLAQLQNGGIEHDDRVPCRPADDAVDIQRENGLERAHRRVRRRAEDGVDGDLGDGGIVLRDTVERDLNERDVAADIALPQRCAGIGFLCVLHRRAGHKLHVLPVIGLQDLDGVRAALRQFLRAPLAEAGARDAHAVAEFGSQRLHKALPPEIVGEQLVDQLGDILVDVAAVDELLVDGRGGGDVKGIAAAAVVFGVDAVEGERDDGQRVRAEGGRLPRRENFAGNDILDVIGERDRHVFRAGIRRAEVDGDGLRDVGDDRRHAIPP